LLPSISSSYILALSSVLSASEEFGELVAAGAAIYNALDTFFEVEWHAKQSHQKASRILILSIETGVLNGQPYFNFHSFGFGTQPY
jgi:hypothetical protein